MSISSISPVSSMQRTVSPADNASTIKRLEKLMDELQKQLQELEKLDTDSVTNQQMKEALRTRIAQVYSRIMAMQG